MYDWLLDVFLNQLLSNWDHQWRLKYWYRGNPSIKIHGMFLLSRWDFSTRVNEFANLAMLFMYSDHLTWPCSLMYLDPALAVHDYWYTILAWVSPSYENNILYQFWKTLQLGILFQKKFVCQSSSRKMATLSKPFALHRYSKCFAKKLSRKHCCHKSLSRNCSHAEVRILLIMKCLLQKHCLLFLRWQLVCLATLSTSSVSQWHPKTWWRSFMISACLLTQPRLCCSKR